MFYGPSFFFLDICDLMRVSVIFEITSWQLKLDQNHIWMK
jgi:hypothetical protein